jgi:MFS family permease
MSEHPLPPSPGLGSRAIQPEHAGLGLVAIFGSTFLQLVGYFMLTPLLVLRLNDGGVSTALVGVFVATGWLGVFCMTPFASAITQRLGRRHSMWLSSGVPVLMVCGFVFSDSLPVWFACVLVEGMAAGLRWVLAEALVAEFSPPRTRGRNVGVFETMVGSTFVAGPALLVWVGAQSDAALWMVLGFSVLGFLWSLLVPRLPPSDDHDQVRVGLRGVWQALRAHPLIVTVGFVGGFFESGLTSILPLYGLALGLGASAAALLVSASGLGSALMMLPGGMLADRMAAHPKQRFGSPGEARQRLMQVCAGITLLASLLMPLVAGTPWLAAPLAFLWGGAGGSLYTLAMIDIGSREQGVTLVNNTAVLVLSYTLGGVLAPALGGAALQWAPTLGFPALLVLVAGVGFARLSHRSR